MTVIANATVLVVLALAAVALELLQALIGGLA
jgi:hypothetical protein